MESECYGLCVNLKLTTILNLYSYIDNIQLNLGDFLYNSRIGGSGYLYSYKPLRQKSILVQFNSGNPIQD